MRLSSARMYHEPDRSDDESVLEMHLCKWLDSLRVLASRQHCCRVVDVFE